MQTTKKQRKKMRERRNRDQYNALNKIIRILEERELSGLDKCDNRFPVDFSKFSKEPHYGKLPGQGQTSQEEEG